MSLSKSKSYFFILLTNLIFSINGIAQKIDYERVAIKYTQLPVKKLPDGIITYKSFVAPDGEAKVAVKLDETLANTLVIQGFDKLTENYDLEIALLLGDFKIDNVTHGFNSVPDTDFDNKPITRIEGKFSFQYKFPFRLRFRNYAGQVLLDTLLSNTPKSVATTAYFTNEAEWNKFWTTKQLWYKAYYQEQQIKADIKEANTFLEYYYAYFNRIAEPKIGVPRNDRKSNFDYDPFQQAFIKINNGFAERKLEDVETGKDKILAAIQIWENEIKQAQPEDKNARVDRKVAYATHLNLAVAYMWIFDFAKAKENLELADKYKRAFAGGDFNGTEWLLNNQSKRHNLYGAWTGTIKAENRKEKPTIYGTGSPWVAMKANNAWLEANPVPDIIEPVNVDHPTVKILLAHPWKAQRIVLSAPTGEKEVYNEKTGFLKTMIYLGGAPITGMDLKPVQRAGSVVSEQNKIDLTSWHFKPDQKVLELIFQGMRGGYFKIMEITNDKIVMREHAREDGSYNILYMIPE